MLLFKDTIQELTKLFDEENKLELSDDEKIILERKSETLLVEGIRFWKDSAAYSNKGQIIFTKNVLSPEMLPEFLGELVEHLQFPGYFSYDFHGTMRHEKKLIFQFASQNSTLRIDDERNFLLLENSHTQKVLADKLRKTQYNDFLEEWFFVHDAVSDLMASGITPERLLSVVVYYEPTSIRVGDLFGAP